MLSVNRKCEQSVTTDGRRTFTKVLGADKEKVHRDQTPEETTAKMQCLTGEVAVRVKTNDLYHDYYMFLHKQRALSAVIFLFLPLVLSLLCVYYIRLYPHVVRECLCSCSKY